MDEYRVVEKDYPGQCFLLGLLLAALMFIGPAALQCWHNPDACKPLNMFNEIVYSTTKK